MILEADGIRLNECVGWSEHSLFTYMVKWLLSCCDLSGLGTLSRQATVSLFCLPFVKGSLLGSKFFLFRADHFSERTCCAGQKTMSHKRCLPFKISRNIGSYMSGHLYEIYVTSFGNFSILRALASKIPKLPNKFHKFHIKWPWM